MNRRSLIRSIPAALALAVLPHRAKGAVVAQDAPEELTGTVGTIEPYAIADDAYAELPYAMSLLFRPMTVTNSGDGWERTYTVDLGDTVDWVPPRSAMVDHAYIEKLWEVVDG